MKADNQKAQNLVEICPAFMLGDIPVNEKVCMWGGGQVVDVNVDVHVCVFQQRHHVKTILY